MEREGSIVAPCDGRPAMPAPRRGPGGLFCLPDAEVMVAAAGGLMTAIWSRCCELQPTIGWGSAG